MVRDRGFGGGIVGRRELFGIGNAEDQTSRADRTCLRSDWFRASLSRSRSASSPGKRSIAERIVESAFDRRKSCRKRFQALLATSIESVGQLSRLIFFFFSLSQPRPPPTTASDSNRKGVFEAFFSFISRGVFAAVDVNQDGKIEDTEVEVAILKVRGG